MRRVAPQLLGLTVAVLLLVEGGCDVSLKHADALLENLENVAMLDMDSSSELHRGETVEQVVLPRGFLVTHGEVILQGSETHEPQGFKAESVDGDAVDSLDQDTPENEGITLGESALPQDLTTSDFTKVDIAKVPVLPDVKRPHDFHFKHLMGPNLFASQPHATEPGVVPEPKHDATADAPAEQKRQMSPAEERNEKMEALETAKSLVRVTPAAPTGGWNTHIMIATSVPQRRDLGEGDLSSHDAGPFNYEYKYEYKYAPDTQAEPSVPHVRHPVEHLVKPNPAICHTVPGDGFQCSTQHAWPGYSCKAQCVQAGCVCRGIKAASCKHLDGKLKCLTGSVVTDCGGRRTEALVENACRDGAVGLL